MKKEINYDRLIKIANRVKKERGHETYHTWGSDDISEDYYFLKNHLLDEGEISFSVNNDVFTIVFRKGGGTGMGEHPDTIIVNLLKVNIKLKEKES